VLLPPQIATTPSVRDLGNVTIGQTGTGTFQIINTGSQTLSGTATLSAGSAPFFLTNSAYSVLAGKTGSVSVIFSPSAGGAFTNLIVFTSNAGAATNTVLGTGVSLGPVSSVPSVVNFGQIATGASAQASITISNLGSSVVTGTVSLGTSAFTIISDSAFTLPGFGATNVVVLFSPVSTAVVSNTLSITSSGGNASTLLTGQGGLPPLPNFTGSPLTGAPPFQVTFTDTSTGSISSRFWQFGDGGTTNIVAVTNTVKHTYTTAGTFSVSLTTSGAFGTNSLTRSHYIVGTNTLSADLSIAVVDTPDPVPAGSNLTYIVTVTNAGPLSASSVIVTNQTGAGAHFQSATLPATTNGAIIAINVGSVLATNKTTFNIVVTPAISGTLAGTFTVRGSQTDTNLNNNTAVSTTTVTAPVSSFANSWILPDSGHWATNENWSLSVSPEAHHSAFITNSAAKTVTLDDTGSPITISNLTVAGSANALLLRDRSATQEVIVTQSLLLQNGGALTVTNASLTVRSLVADGTLTLEPSAILNATNLTSLIASTTNGQARLHGGTWSAKELILGNASAARGTLTVSAGTLQITDQLLLGNCVNSSGLVWLVDGQISNPGTTTIGVSGHGVMIISNGAFLAGPVTVGTSGRGTLTIAGGQMNVTGPFTIRGSGSLAGSAVVDGGTLIATNANTLIGLTGPGQLTLSTGTVALAAVSVGQSSRGTLTMSGGDMEIQDSITLGVTGGSTGIVNVTGGLLLHTNGAIQTGSGIGQLTVSTNALVITRGLVLGQQTNVAANAATITGHLVVTDPTLTGTLQIRSGTLTINQGTISADRLIVTNGTSARVRFHRGHFAAKTVVISNNLSFVVGNGTNAATLQLDGGTYVFASGLLISSNATLAGCGIIVGLIINQGTIVGGCITTNANRPALASKGAGILSEDPPVDALVFTDVVTNESLIAAVDGAVIQFQAPVVNNAEVVVTNANVEFQSDVANFGSVSLNSSGDSDGDGVPNDVDNCPTLASANQTDSDGDGLGDPATTARSRRIRRSPTTIATALVTCAMPTTTTTAWKTRSTIARGRSTPTKPTPMATASATPAIIAPWSPMFHRPILTTTGSVILATTARPRPIHPNPTLTMTAPATCAIPIPTTTARRMKRTTVRSSPIPARRTTMVTAPAMCAMPTTTTTAYRMKQTIVRSSPIPARRTTMVTAPAMCAIPMTITTAHWMFPTTARLFPIPHRRTATVTASGTRATRTTTTTASRMPRTIARPASMRSKMTTTLTVLETNVTPMTTTMDCRTGLKRLMD
jgi:uncharacterized repeat protein (TIGR01451 family)